MNTIAAQAAPAAATTPPGRAKRSARPAKRNTAWEPSAASVGPPEPIKDEPPLPLWRQLTQRLGIGAAAPQRPVPETAAARMESSPRPEQPQQGQLGLPLPAPAAQEDRIPPALKSRYLIADHKYYFRDRNQELAFEDLGQRLRTSHNDADVAASMVELAKAKGWTELKLSGSNDFKRAAWLAAAERGLASRGYRPSAADQARLAERLAERQRDAPQRSNSIEDSAPQPAPADAAPRPARRRRSNSNSNAKSQSASGSKAAKPAPTPSAPQNAAQSDAVAELKKFLRQRGDSEAAVDMTVQLASSELNRHRTHFGQLLEHGAAPYLHDKDNDMSYFVTLKTNHGRQTIWGVDLERAMLNSGAAIDEGIVLVRQDQRGVTVKTWERDAHGQLTGKRVELETDRNQWQVLSLDNARAFATQQERASNRGDGAAADLTPRAPAQRAPARGRSA